MRQETICPFVLARETLAGDLPNETRGVIQFSKKRSTSVMSAVRR
jgi:hypothetical protein